MITRMLAVGLGGFIGANARFLIAEGLPKGAFPLATLAANMLGCFGLAFFAITIAERSTVSESTRLFIATGFFGALTTFSTFQLELYQLIDDGRYGLAAGYMSLSLVLGFLAVLAGVGAARML